MGGSTGLSMAKKPTYTLILITYILNKHDKILNMCKHKSETYINPLGGCYIKSILEGVAPS